MDRETKKFLYDLLQSIEAINSYVGESKRFEDYDSNPMLQDAVERNLEIIGEAMNQVLKRQPGITITDSRRIVDTRNIIIHSYDSLDNTQIWAIIINHLPRLYREVSALIQSNN